MVNKTIITASARLLIPLTFLVTGLVAQQPVRARVNSDNVNLRAGPSLDSVIIVVLRRGTIVTVLAREGFWAKVQAPAASGWFPASQMTVLPPDSTGLPTPAATTPVPEAPRAAPLVPAPTTYAIHWHNNARGADHPRSTFGPEGPKCPVAKSQYCPSFSLRSRHEGTV